MATPPVWSTLTDAELNAFYSGAAAEVAVRYAAKTAKERADQAAADAEAAVAGKPAVTWVAGTVVPPGGKTLEGGREYVNTSKAWLSVPPSQYPLGYQLTTRPTGAAVWKVGEAVKVGDLRAYPTSTGTVFKCLMAHTTQADWTPPVTPALWAVA